MNVFGWMRPSGGWAWQLRAGGSATEPAFTVTVNGSCITLTDMASGDATVEVATSCINVTQIATIGSALASGFLLSNGAFLSSAGNLLKWS